MSAYTIPELPRLIVNGSGKYKYVFTYKNHWVNGISSRGQGDTHSVGKYVPVEGVKDKGEIFFNEAFIAQHPALEHLRVFRYKGGKLEFKPKEETDNLVKGQNIVKLHAGATWALHTMLKDTPVMRALAKVFPEHRSYLRLLSLAYYLVLQSNSSLCDFEEFVDCTWVPYSRGKTGGAISRFLGKISRDKIDRFFKTLQVEWNRDKKEQIEKHQFWALDSTSITSYSEGISSVEYGRNKDLIDAPQTNVLLIIDQRTGQPVYFRNFNGNVPDVSTIRNTISELTIANIDFSQVVVVMDKGYGSSRNWDDMLRSNMSFICNARRNLNAAITEIIDKNYVQLLNWNNGVSYLNQNAVTVPVLWCYDEFPVASKRSQKQTKTTLYVHLYFSKDIADEMARRLQTQLNAALDLKRSEPAALSEAQTKLIATYCDTAEDGTVTINMKKVEEKLKYAGIRVLVSDIISDAVECCIAYEERNEVEHAFNTMKSRLACNRTQVHSTESWDGKLFVQLLATSISAMIRARIKLYNQGAVGSEGTKNYRVFYDSDHKLLAKLNNIYMTRFKDGWIFDEVVGKTKELFKILNLPLPTCELIVDKSDEVGEPQDQGEIADIEEIALETAEIAITDL